MTGFHILCLSVAVYCLGSIPVLLRADDTVDTYRPAWADRLTLRNAALTVAALVLVVEGFVHVPGASASMVQGQVSA